MNKQEFLSELRKRLSGLPKYDVDERLGFYSEMIDDRIEEGLSEEDAVSEIGSVDEVASQIVSDIPLSKLVKEKIKGKRRPYGWEIAFLAIGSPIWLSLIIAAVAVIFSLYITLWSLIASLWAIFASFIGCALGGIAMLPFMATFYNLPTGLAALSAGLVCAGLSIFSFYGCKAATKGTVQLTKKILLWIKKCFIKKETA